MEDPRYEAVVYFAGPKTLWSGKVDDSEVILRKPSVWRWGALRLAKSTHAQLDATRCGWVLLDKGAVVEHVEPLRGAFVK